MSSNGPADDFEACTRLAARRGYLLALRADGSLAVTRLGVPVALLHMFDSLGDHDRGMVPIEQQPEAPHANVEARQLAGATDAQRLLLAVRDGCAPADLLLEAFRQVQATNDAERLRAFARHVQSALKGQA